MIDSDKVWKGKIEILNFSEEYDVEEVNVSFIFLFLISFYSFGMVLMIDIFFFIIGVGDSWKDFRRKLLVERYGEISWCRINKGKVVIIY